LEDEAAEEEEAEEETAALSLSFGTSKSLRSSCFTAMMEYESAFKKNHPTAAAGNRQQAGSRHPKR